MLSLWASWGLTTEAWLVAAPAFALALCIPLSRAAYWLPRSLDAGISSGSTLLHQRYRRIFWITVPLLAWVCACHFGVTFATLAAVIYVATLLTLAWIDAETGFLPDVLTLPLLWLGLLVNLNGTFSLLADAVVGAAVGYLVLWVICSGFFALSGRQGMGHGDFKLLAALGAWLGWAPLAWVLLVSCTLALAVALPRRWFGNLKAGEAFSFGPYLAISGIAGLLL